MSRKAGPYSIGITQNCPDIEFDVDIVHRAVSATLNEHAAKSPVSALSKRATATEYEISVLLTTEAEMRALNSAYRSIDAPTDVLAFAMREDEACGAMHPMLLGDIVISLETAAQQAAAAKHSLETEVAFLTAHGTLHLLGYEHATPEQESIMFKKQETTLRGLRLSEISS